MGLLNKIFSPSKPAVVPTSVTDENFAAEVLDSDTPVLLDIWGPNCGPCKRLEPIIMRLAKDFDGQVKICEMNIQGGMRTAAKFSVRGTPTILYFRSKGRLRERVVGFRGYAYHKEVIEEELLPPPEA